MNKSPIFEVKNYQYVRRKNKRGFCPYITVFRRKNGTSFTGLFNPEHEIKISKLNRLEIIRGKNTKLDYSQLSKAKIIIHQH